MPKEDPCVRARHGLAESLRRQVELEERGGEALSRYDREIAFRGDAERGLVVSKQLVANHVVFYARQLERCPRPLVEVAEASPAPSTHSAPPKEAKQEPLARQATLFELPS
jgi:hypothetical protein